MEPPRGCASDLDSRRLTLTADDEANELVVVASLALVERSKLVVTDVAIDADLEHVVHLAHTEVELEGDVGQPSDELRTVPLESHHPGITHHEEAIRGGADRIYKSQLSL